MCQPRSCTLQARDANDDDVNLEVTTGQNDDAHDEVYDDDDDDDDDWL